MIRGSDPRRRSVASVALTLLPLLGFDSAARASQPPPSFDFSRDAPGPTLDSDEFFALRTAIETLDVRRIAQEAADGRADASQCTLSPTRVACRMLRISIDEADLEARRMVREDETATFEKLHYRPSDSPRRFRFTEFSHGGGAIDFENLRVDPPDERNRVVVAEGKVRSESIELIDVRWQSAPERDDRSDDDTGADPAFETRLTADRVTWSEGRWRADRLRRSSPFSVGLGRYESDAPRPASGLLPPRAAASGRSVELTPRAVHGPSSTGLTASLTPGEWFGLGPLVQTPPSLNPFDAHTPRPALLDAQLRWRPAEQTLGWSLLGHARRGSEYVHAGAHLEEQSTDRFWRTARVDQPGVLRARRTSRAGIALSGPRHHLQLSLARRTPVDLGVRADDGSPVAGDAFAAGLEFALQETVFEHLELAAELAHANRVYEAAADRHRSSIAGDATLRIGAREAVHADAGATALMAMDLAPTSGEQGGTSGFDVQRGVQLVGHASTGATVTGRAGEALHRLRPRLAGYLEILGAGGEPSAPAPFAAPPARVPGWTAATAVLGQSLEFQRATVEFPAGMLVDRSDDERLGPPDAFGRFRLDWRDWALSGDLRHPIGGNHLAGSAGIARVGRRVEAGWRLTTDPTSAGLRARADRLASHPLEALRLLQPLAAERDGSAGLFQMLTLGTSIASLRTDLAVFASGPHLFPDEGPRHGFTADLTRPLPPFGWGLNLHGEYLSAQNQWGIAAGLETTRQEGGR